MIRQSYSIHSLDFSSSIIVSPAPVILLGFTVYNKGPAQFIQIFDASDIPADASVPDLPLPIQADNILGMFWGSEGRYMENGLVITNSTTDDVKTLGGEDCWFDVQIRSAVEK